MSENPPSQEMATAPDAGMGGDLQLTLACPQCGTQGWVDLKRLRRGLCCPRCSCNFFVGHNGQMQSEADLPRLRFECPRCQLSGHIPKYQALKKVVCGSCQLPLSMGPDRQLHGSAEALQMRRAAMAQADRPKNYPWAEWVASHFFTEQGQMNKLNVAVGTIVLLIVMIVGSQVILSLFADSAASHAKRFTYTCLAGEWDQAHDELEDNDVARAEFRRWRSYHFASILDAYRPAGDRVTIDAQPVSETDSGCIFLVTMNSKFLGERQHRQYWTKLEDGWRFDVLQTLREIDQPTQ